MLDFCCFEKYLNQLKRRKIHFISWHWTMAIRLYAPWFMWDGAKHHVQSIIKKCPYLITCSIQKEKGGQGPSNYATFIGSATSQQCKQIPNLSIDWPSDKVRGSADLGTFGWWDLLNFQHVSLWESLHMLTITNFSFLHEDSTSMT